MTAVILQYQDPMQLVDGTVHYNGPVVTAQTLMALAYRKQRIVAYDMKFLLDTLFSDWYSSIRVLQQHLLLSELLKNAKRAFDENTIVAFTNNKIELLRSFRDLIEIAGPLVKLPENNDEERLFARLFRDFCVAPQSGVQTVNDVWQGWCNKEAFRHRLLQILELQPGTFQNIYFQGFYYIRPIQSRLIEAIESLGIKVYFLNAFDSSYPLEYEVWSKNPRFATSIKAFSIGNGKNKKLCVPEFLKFEDVFSMVTYLRKQDSKTHLYAPMTRDVREIIENFFPGSDEKDSLLAYPAGRYLFNLYCMWERKTNSLQLNADNVNACLATGWAGQRFNQNTDILNTFRKVRHYFEDCRALDEWSERLDLFEKVVKEVLPLFTSALVENANSRWLKTLSSPFSTIGAFNASYEEVSDLVATLRNMFADATYLFNNGVENIDLIDHFERVKNMLSRKARKQDIRSEEKQILTEITHRLSNGNIEISSCPPAHIAEAMTFFLGGSKAVTESEYEEETIGDVNGIANIESAHLFYQADRVLLCCCDSNQMPGRSRGYSWPLNREYLSNLGLAGADATRLQDYVFFRESTVLSNRYLFHLATLLPKLTVSWIHKLGDKELSPSIYIRLLSSDPQSVKSINGLLLPSRSQQPTNCNNNVSQEVQVYFRNQQENLPAEVESDLKVCPHGGWRFFYNFAISDGPFYTSEFHLNFLISRFIALMADGCLMSINEAAKQIFNIYPSFTPSQKQELIDWANRIKKDLIPAFGKESYDHGFTRGRLYLNYLGTSIQDVKLLQENRYKTSHVACRYCPHGAYCYVRYAGID